MRKATYSDIAQAYSDAFKDLHGVRPRVPSWWGFNEYSDNLQNVQHLLEQELREEREAHSAAILAVMQAGAPDTATAERWLKEAMFPGEEYLV
jgi:hypothetical protein